jgi:predicted PurR-regulated permease PerM
LLNRCLPAAGVATTYGLVQVLLIAWQVLNLIGLAMFLAVGLDPAVRLLVPMRDASIS